MKTNYSTCDTMDGIEINVFYDCCAARSDFEDNFECLNLRHTGRETPCYFFTGSGETEAPADVADCYDFSKTTELDFLEFVKGEGALDGVEFWDYGYERDQYGSWRDFALNLLYETDIPTCMKDGFPSINNATLLYTDTTTTTGYSQGDYAHVLYKPEGYLAKEEVAREEFGHLIWEAPVYARVTIDDQEEYYLEESQSDSYRWDRDEAVEFVNKLPISDAAKEWIAENLPECPDYVY